MFSIQRKTVLTRQAIAFKIVAISQKLYSSAKTSRVVFLSNNKRFQLSRGHYLLHWNSFQSVRNTKTF